MIKYHLPNYLTSINGRDPVWQPRYYRYNIFSPEKMKEKINYIHENPVRIGLVNRPEDWAYGSARYYISGKSVGLPIEFPG
ncbi:MAG: hypothetical protein JRI95_06590 [Deltaproteobacteria bacterium]|nr:hypothetical protein [Deltaproteobacteria bacterium]MBW2085546.1 hypothetical protein [Deltaproteobacteria bacterium]